jgi:hypothetical protein
MSDNFERILKHKDGYELRLIVGKPIPTDDGNQDWQCDYKIEGLGNAKVRQAVGVDPIQAIMLALTYLSTTLYFSDEYKDGKLSWLGGSDLGLPIAEIVQADVERLRAKVDSLHNAHDA